MHTSPVGLAPSEQLALSVPGHPEGKGLQGGGNGAAFAASQGLGNPLRPNKPQRGKGPAQQCPGNALFAAQGRSIQFLLPLRCPQDALKPQLVLCLLVL